MEHIHGTYNTGLVAISYLIAAAASYTALDAAIQIGLSKGRMKWIWLSLGALTMGLGIWSMHFVGMLAFSLPYEIVYDLLIVVISAVAAILGSFVALYVVQRSYRQMSFRNLVIGGLLLALGVVIMHYVGMAAIRVEISYDPFLFIMSLIIAVIASLAAVWLAFYFQKGNQLGFNWRKLGSGLIMGAAISGMHYIGMLAASFYNSVKPILSVGFMLNQYLMAVVVIITAILTIALFMLGSFFSKRLASKDSEIAFNERWYRSLYDNNDDGIISLDIHRHIIGVNEAAYRMTGLASEDVWNKPIGSLQEMIIESDRILVQNIVNDAYKGGSVSVLTKIKVHNSHQIDINVSLIPVHIDGEVVGVYFIFKDITEERRNQRKIEHLAFHDELTDLPNRRLFNQSIEALIKDREHEQSQFEVFMLDVDRFKLVNDTLGHIYGDLFIKEISRRIMMLLMEEDVLLARIGGDEFAILLRQFVSKEHSGQLADRILKGIQQPYRLKDTDIYISASIGISIFPKHGSTVLELIKSADTAMYSVKNKGRNSYAVYSEEMDANYREKLKLEGEILRGLERNEFVLHYQPQFQADKQALIGLEALVRWQHPTKGLLQPGEFISVAEESGLIRELGSWILKEACRQIKAWQDAGKTVVPVAVNLSSQQFHEPAFAEFVRDTLHEAGVDPEYLELEITESTMMDASLSGAVLTKLSEFGIRISLDDFGTGYSSLSYLKLFPIQRLKIDRSFIREITSNMNDKAIVATIVAMAKNLNINVIAEGIETKEQLSILLEQGCHEIQGYLFSKPLSVLQLEEQYLKKLS